MAIYRRDQPEYNAAVANGAKNIKLTGGGALAGGKTWDGKQLNAPTAPASATPRLDGGSATPRLDAGVATPRLDKNPARNTADAVASSNRSGAFGTGPQQLQSRKDLFNQMASAKPQDRAKFQGQAAALGVKKGGWDAAMNRLSMGQSSAPAAPAAAQTPSAPLQGKALAQNNIATMGTQGAVQDYMQRSAADKAAASAAKDVGRRKQWDKATAMPKTSPMAPLPPKGASPFPQSAVPSPEPNNTPTPAPTPTPTNPTTPPAQDFASIPKTDTTGRIDDVGNGSTQDGKFVGASDSNGDGARSMGAVSATGAASRAVRAAVNPTASKLILQGLKGSQLAGEAGAAMSKSTGMAATATEAAKKTTGAAAKTFEAAAKSHMADSVGFAAKQANLGKVAPVYQKAGSALAKVGNVASLGKLGKAAGRAAPWVTAAQGIYEGAALAGSADRRERRINELEQSAKTAMPLSGRAAIEGALNPVAVTYAAAMQGKKAWDSTGNAKASGVALKQAEARSAKRAEIKAQLGDKWKTMTPKERVAAYNAA